MGGATPIYATNRYPTAQTVTTCRGLDGSSSNLRRSSATCESTVRVSTCGPYPRYLAQQLCPRDHLAVATGQRDEQSERLGCERALLPAARYRVRPGIDDDRSESDRAVPILGGSAAEQSADGLDQFEHTEWAGHMLDTVQPQSLHVLRRVPLAQDQNGHVASALAQGVQEIGPVRGLAHEVEHYEVRGPGEGGREAALSRRKTHLELSSRRLLARLGVRSTSLLTTRIRVRASPIGAPRSWLRGPAGLGEHDSTTRAMRFAASSRITLDTPARQAVARGR